MLVLLVEIGQANAQSPGNSRVAEGTVVRPGAERPVPVSGQWVVLHRVGSDRAAPLDSMRSGPDGRFRFRYQATGAADALYFVSARYDGIAYFSPPLRGDAVRGGDADIVVYATTSDTSALHLQGHHIVVGSPRGRRREVAEIFELDNDGTTTVVSRDSVTPLWATYVPPDADSVRVAPGDVGAGAVALRKGRAEVFAPISPGVRQLVLTYVLPVDAFPVSWPVQRATAVLEVLVEETRARVEGARLGEVPSAAIEGRSFRRFLSRDVEPNAVVRVDAPAPGESRQPAMRVLAIVVALVMLVALVVWRVRGRSMRVAPAAVTSETLIAELATLDARFERTPNPDAELRGRYDRERAELKARIERALADENSRA